MELVASAPDGRTMLYLLRTGNFRHPASGDLGPVPLAVVLSISEGSQPSLSPEVAEGSIIAMTPYYAEWKGDAAEKARIEGIALNAHSAK